MPVSPNRVTQSGESDMSFFVKRHESKGLLRLRQTPNALRLVVRHPSWLAEALRGAIRRRRALKRHFSLAYHADLFSAEPEAVAAVTGCSEEDCRAALAHVWSPLSGVDGDSHPAYGAEPDVVRIVGAVVALARPETMVETGVAQGVSTAAILDAMERNGRGMLFSVDLPVLDVKTNQFVGHLVPGRLRHRWSLELGPSRRVLPGLIERAGPIDIFLHDADHTYEAQMEEYRTAWRQLKPGGILLSDDVNNAAFVEFASEVGVRPYLVGDPHARSAIGLACKEG
jgi:predicted O-methyltransferase YrrM